MRGYVGGTRGQRSKKLHKDFNFVDSHNLHLSSTLEVWTVEWSVQGHTGVERALELFIFYALFRMTLIATKDMSRAVNNIPVL